MGKDQEQPENADMENSERSSSRPRLGKGIVSAWFMTVINPLLRALELQQDALNQKNYTWRYRTREFELIGRPSDQLQPEYFPNLEHFIEIYPDVLDMLMEHGKHAEYLREACSELQSVLENSPDVRSIYRNAMEEGNLKEYGRTREDLFGAYPERDNLSYLAQLVINHTPELPDYYSIHPLWNRFRSQFLEVLVRPGVSELAGKVDQAANQLSAKIDNTIKRLKDIRRELSHEYDVPFVGPDLRAA